VVYLRNISPRRGTQARVPGATNVLTARSSQHDTATEGARAPRLSTTGNGEGVGAVAGNARLPWPFAMETARWPWHWAPVRQVGTSSLDRLAGEASTWLDASADLALRRMAAPAQQTFCARATELGAAVITRTQSQVCCPSLPITARLPRCVDRSL
jgi:hypothetical protein